MSDTGKKTSLKHTSVKFNGSKMKFLIPDGYKKLKHKNPVRDVAETLVNSRAYYQKETENSFNTISIAKCLKDKTLNFDNVKVLIDSIHSSLEDNQGLIEVDSGISVTGYKYIYSIIRTAETDKIFNYVIQLKLSYREENINVEALFKETGTIGTRKAIGADLACKAGLIDSLDDPTWNCDPYDPSYKHGIPMNLAESHGLDELFPNSPLTQARELIEAILDNELAISNADESYNSDSINEKDMLLSLFNSTQKSHSHAADFKTDNTNKPKSSSKSKSNSKTAKSSMDDKLKEAINQYNYAYTIMSDRGSSLYLIRVRTVDLISNIEYLINTIANHPKQFDTTMAAFTAAKKSFISTGELAKEELELAQKSAINAVVGFSGATTVTLLAPSAATWIATTFGTASTGTAISTLSGAAASNAALAWLGGGALTAGGSALLALAGPIGWSIAGVTLLSTIVLFTNNKMKMNKQKKAELDSVILNTSLVKKADAQIAMLVDKTAAMRNSVNGIYSECLGSYNQNYLSLPETEQIRLGTLVNETNSSAAFLKEAVSSS